MIKPLFCSAALLCLLGLAVPDALAQAGDARDSSKPAAVASAPLSSASSADAMSTRCRENLRRNPITPAVFHGRWSGKRAGKPLTFTLQNNADMPGSLEGNYTWRRAAIQLAGDNDGVKLSLEESSDGTAVTGIWELQLCNGRLSGQWLDANYANAEAVELRRQ